MWVVEGTGDISPHQAAQPHAARGVTTNVNGASLQFDEYGKRGAPRTTQPPQENHVVPGVVRPLYEENKNAIQSSRGFILNRAALVKGFGLTVQIIATCDATEKRVKLLKRATFFPWFCPSSSVPSAGGFHSDFEQQTLKQFTTKRLRNQYVTREMIVWAHTSLQDSIECEPQVMALCRVAACARGVSVKVNVPTRFLASSSGSGGIGAEAGADKGTNAEQQQTTHFGFKRVPTALKQGGSLGHCSVCAALGCGRWPMVTVP
jgi:hypothetical protein